MVVIETQLTLSGAIVPGFVTGTELQAPPYVEGCGEVVIGISAHCHVLDSMQECFFIVAVLDVEGAGTVMVGGEFIPPANSRAGWVPYTGTLDQPREAVAMLTLRHSIPREHVLLVGDYNAHL